MLYSNLAFRTFTHFPAENRGSEILKCFFNFLENLLCYSISLKNCFFKSFFSTFLVINLRKICLLCYLPFVVHYSKTDQRHVNLAADRDWPVDKLKDVKVADALKHPNWNMGKKITVDSATLFNKALP